MDILSAVCTPHAPARPAIARTQQTNFTYDISSPFPDKVRGPRKGPLGGPRA